MAQFGPTTSSIQSSTMLLLPFNINSSLEAYQQFVRQCDAPESRTAVTFTFAYTFFVVYTMGLPLQICILPANARLAKHRSAFLLLFYINMLDVFWLLQYIWLCVEFMVGLRLVVPYSLDAYLFRIVNFCIDALYIQLALNRCIAVLDSRGRLYEKLFNLWNTKMYICGVLVGSIGYSIYTNHLPERRPFHCLKELSYFEPTTSIPKALLDQLADTGVYDVIQHVYMACIFVPVFMYIAVFAKLLLKFVRRKLSLHTTTGAGAVSVYPAPVGGVNGISMMPAPSTSNRVSSSISHSHPQHQQNANNNNNNKFTPNYAAQQQSQQLNNFALERSRLFLLCFISQVPYLLANGFHLYRTAQIDDQTLQLMAIFWQFFGTIFHVQQPVLMLLLSRDMRREVKEDFGRLIATLKEKLMG